jgi:hypothetical protein
LKKKRRGRKAFPDRKISETFLDFASTLVDFSDPETPKDMLEQTLCIAFLVWNAVVFADATGDNRFLRDIRKRLEHDPIEAAILESYVERKRAEFAEDFRLVGEYKLTRSKDMYNLRVEARSLPPDDHAG